MGGLKCSVIWHGFENNNLENMQLQQHWVASTMFNCATFILNLLRLWNLPFATGPAFENFCGCHWIAPRKHPTVHEALFIYYPLTSRSDVTERGKRRRVFQALVWFMRCLRFSFEPVPRAPEWNPSGKNAIDRKCSFAGRIHHRRLAF